MGTVVGEEMFASLCTDACFVRESTARSPETRVAGTIPLSAVRYRLTGHFSANSFECPALSQLDQELARMAQNGLDWRSQVHELVKEYRIQMYMEDWSCRSNIFDALEAGKRTNRASPSVRAIFQAVMRNYEKI